MAPTITPNLWFDGTAGPAVKWYTELFPNSRITSTEYYPASQAEGLADFQTDMAGKELTVAFELDGQSFIALNAGPEFAFNKSVSLMVNFDPSRDPQARQRLDELWDKLSQEGEVIMTLDTYPFSPRYGWVKDRYGLNWQLILTNPEGEPRPNIVPSLLFAGPAQSQAEAAMTYYQQIFTASQAGTIARYPADTGPAKAGTVMYGDFKLQNLWFATMDSGVALDDTFNEAISFVISCADQAAIDYYWQKLSANPASEQCGWCKDRFGLSWQIVPANMGELMQAPGAFGRMMQMKKIDIAGLAGATA